MFKSSLSLSPGLRRLADVVVPSRRKAAISLVALNRKSMDLAGFTSLVELLLREESPFAIARPGGTESEGLQFFLQHRLNPLLASFKLNYPKWFAKAGPELSGITHASAEDLDNFCAEYLAGILDADALGFGAYASGSLGVVQVQAQRGVPIFPIHYLEPLEALRRGQRPWTLALASKNVLVVHPFSETIRSQVAKRDQITGVKEFLPKFDLQTELPPVTFAGVGSTRPWLSHYRELEQSVALKNFDVALVGAGAYGLPLAAAIKRSGRQAIHLGGSLQLLFGISGRRWDGHPLLEGVADNTWIRPSTNETPKGASLVEGGTYW